MCQRLLEKVPGGRAENSCLLAQDSQGDQGTGTRLAAAAPVHGQSADVLVQRAGVRRRDGQRAQQIPVPCLWELGDWVRKDRNSHRGF